MKDYNIQSCQWMACNHFCQPTQNHIVDYVKNIYLQPLVVGWISLYGCGKVQYERPFFLGSGLVSFDLSNKSWLGNSWQIVDFMFTFEDFWILDGLSIKWILLPCTNGVHFINNYSQVINFWEFMIKRCGLVALRKITKKWAWFI